MDDGGPVQHAEGDDRQAAGHVDAGRRRAEQRDQAEQVAEQDEQEQRPQERRELVGVVFADGRPGDLVADEGQQRLETCSTTALGQVAVFGPAGQRDEDQRDQDGGHQLQDHELGEVEGVAEQREPRQLPAERVAEEAVEQLPDVALVEDVAEGVGLV